MCESPFFNKIAALSPTTLLKKETLAQVFSCEYYEISKNTFFTEHLWTTASELQNGMLMSEFCGMKIQERMFFL